MYIYVFLSSFLCPHRVRMSVVLPAWVCDRGRDFADHQHHPVAFNQQRLFFLLLLFSKCQKRVSKLIIMFVQMTLC